MSVKNRFEVEGEDPTDKLTDLRPLRPTEDYQSMDRLHKILYKLKWYFKAYFGYTFLVSIMIQICMCLVFNVIFSPLYFIYRPWYQKCFQMTTEFYMQVFPRIWYYIMKNRVYLTGDDMIVNENAIWMSNHTHAWDFMATCLTAPLYGRIGAMRFLMKEQIKNIPIIGFGLYWMDNIYLKRNFKEDQKHINMTFRRLRNKWYPFWLIVYPEGTRNRPKKIEESQQYAREHGLPVFEHIVNPRPTGIMVAIQQLRNVVPYIYDITLQYGDDAHIAMAFCPNEGIDIHMNVSVIKMEVVPEYEEELKDWLNERWKRKDDLVGYFKKHKRFPGQGRYLPYKHVPVDFTGYMKPDCFYKD